MHLRNDATIYKDWPRPAAAKDQPWTMSCERSAEDGADAPLRGWQLLLRLYSEDEAEGGIRQSADGPTPHFAHQD